MRIDKRKFPPLMGGQQYWQRIRALFGSSLIGYWPLWEISGTVAVDIASGNNGAYVNATLNNDTSPGSKPALFMAGTNSAVNIYSAALAAAFDGLEGTLVLQAKFHPDTWTDGQVRQLYRLRADASNFIQIYKDASNIVQVQYVAGGSNKGISFVTTTPDYLTYTMRWSKSGDKVVYDVNGTPLQTAINSLSAWSGALAAANTNLGSTASSGGSYKGWMANALYINRFISDDESILLAKALDPQLKIWSVIGDSITRLQSTSLQPWQYRAFLTKHATIKNHAASGNSIMGQMDDQRIAAANDSADVIFLALGTNDNDAWDMAALQAKVESNIIALRASNPRATIYYFNVLPRWTDSTGATPIDKSHIRAAIAAACTAQSVTCWDTYTTPWITAAQTSDGLHPTAAGHAAIAAEILTRLP